MDRGHIECESRLLPLNVRVRRFRSSGLRLRNAGCCVNRPQCNQHGHSQSCVCAHRCPISSARRILAKRRRRKQCPAGLAEVTLKRCGPFHAPRCQNCHNRFSYMHRNGDKFAACRKNRCNLQNLPPFVISMSMEWWQRWRKSCQGCESRQESCGTAWAQGVSPSIRK